MQNNIWTNSITISHLTLRSKEIFRLSNSNLWPEKYSNCKCILLFAVKFKSLSNFCKLIISMLPQSFWMRLWKDQQPARDKKTLIIKLLKWLASWWDKLLQRRKWSIKRCKGINNCCLKSNIRKAYKEEHTDWTNKVKNSQIALNKKW